MEELTVQRGRGRGRARTRGHRARARGVSARTLNFGMLVFLFYINFSTLFIALI